MPITAHQNKFTRRRRPGVSYTTLNASTDQSTSDAIPRYKPCRRSMQSNARDPARTTCMISSDLLARSLARNTSSKFFVLFCTASWTFSSFPSVTTSAIDRSDATSPLAPSMFLYMSFTRRTIRFCVDSMCKIFSRRLDALSSHGSGISTSSSDSAR
eukprot:30003-Pelagococcus_subviridis.AAC.4